MTPGNLVCDLDGVVYLGQEAIPGSAAALGRLQEAGWHIIMCTNNSSRTPSQVADRIAHITGFEVPVERVLTSAQAAALMLSETRPSTFVLGGEGITMALLEAGVPVVESASEAEAVVVGLAVDLTYSWLREAVTAVRGGARLIATNLDATYPTEDGLWPGGGAIVAAVETASGAEAEAAGKPFQPMLDLITRCLQPGPVWGVGDRQDTDLALAVKGGWQTALVLTGVTSSAEGVIPPPDLVAVDLARVADHLLR